MKRLFITAFAVLGVYTLAVAQKSKGIELGITPPLLQANIMTGLS
jgi:hypothetical protein